MIGMMTGFGFLAMAFVALAVIAIVVLVVWVVIQQTGRRQDGAQGSESARQILDRRYAAGEIDHEEYEQRRRALGG
jgi:putative membrane protein